MSNTSELSQMEVQPSIASIHGPSLDVDLDLDCDHHFPHLENRTEIPVQPRSDVFHSASAIASAMAVLCRGFYQVGDN